MDNIQTYNPQNINPAILPDNIDQFINSIPDKPLFSNTQLIALKNKGLSYNQIAEKTGIPRSTIFCRLKTEGYNEEDNDIFAGQEISLIKHLKQKLLFSLSDDAIQKIQPFQRIVGYGILNDKQIQLERGSATGQADPGPLGSMMQDITAIATRSPQVFNTIINVVGQLPDNVRDIVARMLPQSHANSDNSTIDVTG